MTERNINPPNGSDAPHNGVYGDLFKAIEKTYLSQIESPSLEDEIQMLRLLMRRVLDLAQEVDDLALAIKVLSALGAASQRIMGLRRVQQTLAGDKRDEVSTAFSEALTEVIRKFDLQ